MRWSNSKKRWQEKNKDKIRQDAKIRNERNKEHLKEIRAKRYRQTKEGAYKWYHKKVTGYLDYHYGEEKFQVK